MAHIAFLFNRAHLRTVHVEHDAVRIFVRHYEVERVVFDGVGNQEMLRYVFNYGKRAEEKVLSVFKRKVSGYLAARRAGAEAEAYEAGDRRADILFVEFSVLFFSGFFDQIVFDHARDYAQFCGIEHFFGFHEVGYRVFGIFAGAFERNDLKARRTGNFEFFEFVGDIDRFRLAGSISRGSYRYKSIFRRERHLVLRREISGGLFSVSRARDKRNYSGDK